MGTYCNLQCGVVVVVCNKKNHGYMVYSTDM